MIEIVLRGLRCLALYSLMWSIPSTFSQHALIFDPMTLEIYDPVENTNPQKGRFSVFAVACPTSDNEYDAVFNHKYSLGNAALLVRNVVRKELSAIEYSRCEYDIALSMAYHHTNDGKKHIEFGYDVYNDFTEFHEGKFKQSVYADFERVFKSDSKIESSSSEEKSDRKTNPRKGKFDLHNKSSEELGFIWINKIILNYEETSWNVISATYKIYRNATQLATQCDDYKMGDQMYKQKSLDDLYSIKNQEKIFSSVILPQSACSENRYCLTKYNLVPAYVFQPTSSTSDVVSCTNLTSVPVWNKVPTLLNYLNEFLFAMAQITEKRLIVTSGTYKTLTLPSTNGNTSKEIYLYPEENKVPVPKIIYYIARYRPFPCLKLEICWYDVVIVIHNEPEVSNQDKLCTQDMCQLWGLENVQYLSPTDRKREKSEHIYCCKFDQILADKLKRPPRTPQYSDLDLKKFPTYYNWVTGVIGYFDKQKEFESMMALLPSLKEALLKKSAGKSLKRKKIQRPAFNPSTKKHKSGDLQKFKTDHGTVYINPEALARTEKVFIKAYPRA